jgi:hypothetical protein
VTECIPCVDRREHAAGHALVERAAGIAHALLDQPAFDGTRRECSEIQRFTRR